MKASPVYAFCVIAVCFFTTVRTQGSGQKQPAQPQTPAKQIQTMEAEISLLKKDVAGLKDSTSNMQFQLTRLEYAKDANKNIELDMSSRDSQRLDTDTGSFLVSVNDASPYLDGYRVMLDIGNPSFATYRGFNLTVKWNAKYNWDKFTERSYESWKKTTREKEISYTNSLDPGAWNAVEILLPATDSEHLSYCEISMQTHSISLHGTQ